MRIFLTALFIISFFGLISCNSTKNIAGTYRNNFADLGFFGTTIRLMQDSSLQYVFQGDLMYDSITGHYTIYRNKLYLNFDKEPTHLTKLYYRFDNIPLKTQVRSGDTIKYKLSYVIAHDKLFSIHVVTGKKVTKARTFHKRKKYILFGSHHYDKRHYLKKRD